MIPARKSLNQLSGVLSATDIALNPPLHCNSLW